MNLVLENRHPEFASPRRETWEGKSLHPEQVIMNPIQNSPSETASSGDELNLEFQDLKITGVEKDSITRDPSQLRGYRYPLNLSGSPDDRWRRFLMQAFRASSFPKKRPLEVSGATITIIVTPDEQVQAQFNFLKELVRIANEEYRKLARRKCEELRSEETRRRQEEETLSRLRAQADEMIFT